MKDTNKAILYAAIAVLSWSTVATMFKVALRNFTHFEMLLIASFTALCIFSVTMTIQRKWALLSSLPSRQWGKFALIGLLNPVAYYLVLFKAYNLLPAQVAQPINYCWPIVLLVLLAIFAHQQIPALKYIGMALSLTGVVFISLGGTGLQGEGLPVGGLLLALLSAFLWASYWIVNNMNKHIDGTVILFLSFLFGSIYLLIASFFVGVNLHSIPGILSSMYVGAFEMGIPFIFFGLAIRKTDNSALINQMCYLSPFLSLFFIHLVLGEHIYITTYIGLFLIVFGIVFNEYIIKYFQRKRGPINT
ncbi:MAG: DMT family transporter [Dysgonomonas sp.]|uniref:DMT family transporter n=1 Tax=Dysgonomonas sp. TaxID=1891233 RepID=UPI0039E29C23